MKTENEIKKEMSQREQQDSFTTGTPGKEGSFKCYFDIEEESKKEVKDSKVYKLLQLKIAIEKLA